jgi:hypothetical protein
MSLRSLPNIAPRQSASSSIFASISWEDVIRVPYLAVNRDYAATASLVAAGSVAAIVPPPSNLSPS